MNNCPKCNAAITEGDLECRACGILFSKWREREDNLATGNMGRYAAIANATSSGFNWTILVVVCLFLGGLIYFMGQNANP
jgi:uncharacterized membrane protein YvbJ